MAFAFGVSGDVGVVFGEFMDDTAVGGVEVNRHRFASGADFFNPTLGTLGDTVGTLAFVVGDVNIDASDLGIFRDKSLTDDVLETTEIFCVFADE